MQRFLHSCSTYPRRSSQAFHISACLVSGASLDPAGEPLAVVKTPEIRGDVWLAGVS